jgi:zinc transport system ATP-binding protein
MTNTALLSAENLSLRLGGRQVLDKVSLRLLPGQILTLIGPNGAGKTSLLRVLLGLQAPTSGRVERAPGLRTGYMPQRLHLDGQLPLTARRFLELGGASGAALRTVAAETGAEAVLESPLAALSGGELQRVLLARALLREPQVLVLDEPARGVDVVGQADLYRLIGEVRDRHGCGVLLVSHDLHLVMAAADQVLCLNHHVCCMGRPEAIARDPAYQALFSPAVLGGLALYTHHHDHAHNLHGDVLPTACAGHEHPHG